MSKGGGSQPSQQTVTNTSLPEEFFPYLERLMNQGESISARPYEAYPGQRLADFSGSTLQSFDQTAGAQGSFQPFFDTAQSGVNSAMEGTVNAAGGQARDVYAGQWGTAAANQYMDPYLSTVMDRQFGRMERQYGRDVQGLDARAREAGAYGGSRHAVLESNMRDDFLDRVSDQEAQAMSNAYNTGMEAYSGDQSRWLQAQGANQQADQEMYQRWMSGAGQMGQLAGQAAGMGGQYSDLLYGDADALRRMGLTQEQMSQAGLDMGYQDFVNQRDYERQNLAMMSGLLRGIPMPVSSDTQQTQYQNPYAQALGLGLGLYGMNQNMGSGGA
jgi:hypothetical protein